MGGLAQLNHPNFHYGADGPLVAALARDGLMLLEIANESWDSNDTPDEKGRRRPRPSGTRAHRRRDPLRHRHR